MSVTVEHQMIREAFARLCMEVKRKHGAFKTSDPVNDYNEWLAWRKAVADRNAYLIACGLSDVEADEILRRVRREPL